MVLGYVRFIQHKQSCFLFSIISANSCHSDCIYSLMLTVTVIVAGIIPAQAGNKTPVRRSKTAIQTKNT